MMNINTFNTHIKPLAPYFFWGLVAIVMQLLLMEHSGTLPGFPHLDKIIHACLFAMLTIVGYLSYFKYQKWLYLGLIFYGAATEILQDVFTSTRFASIYDWFADIAGILLAMLVIKIITSHFKMKSSYAN